MNRISPPTGVQAKPVTTPAWSFPSYTSRSREGPRMVSKLLFVIFAFSTSPMAISLAVLRISLATFLSKFLTPLSRV